MKMGCECFRLSAYAQHPCSYWCNLQAFWCASYPIGSSPTSTAPACTSLLRSELSQELRGSLQRCNLQGVLSKQAKQNKTHLFEERYVLPVTSCNCVPKEHLGVICPRRVELLK
ncbi:hypothetical protein LEMLEM_LOCUS13631 [Lemmus lemmus]